MSKILLIFLEPGFQSGHIVFKSWPFLKSRKFIQCFRHLHIHIHTNKNFFGQRNIHRWLCCVVKMGCCSRIHTVDESMVKETHCRAGRWWPRRMLFWAMFFVMKAHNSLVSYILSKMQWAQMLLRNRSLSVEQIKRGQCCLQELSGVFWNSNTLECYLGRS